MHRCRASGPRQLGVPGRDELSGVRLHRELLHRSNRRGILLSWARPGQGGRCHVSLREPAWVVSSFESLGYAVDHPATEQARSAADLKWMQHNFLVLRRAPPVKGPS